MTPFAATNVVTSIMGPRWGTYHYGIDVTNPYGDWTIREVTGAVVTNIWNSTARGLVLETTTDTGAVQRYQHLKETLVPVGAVVPQGTRIAIAGNSGDSRGDPRPDNEYMGGRHLHFEVLINGKNVNPSAWLGLPNATGTYKGNDDLDNPDQPIPPPPSPEPNIILMTFEGGPASPGDVRSIEKFVSDLGIPIKFTEVK